jgi:DNA-binding protein YbaB
MLDAEDARRLSRLIKASNRALEKVTKLQQKKIFRFAAGTLWFARKEKP